MSRRQTSARMVACANEAKVAHDTHVALHNSVTAICKSWSDMPAEDTFRALQASLLEYMPTTIMNSLMELSHFRLDGKRIAQERVRRQGKSKNLIDTSEPDVHPYPIATPETVEDFIGTPEEQAAFEQWNKGDK